MERQRESSKHGLDRFGNMDTPGIEPGASRMLSGCDTTTPCALLAQLDLVDFLVHLLAFHLMIRNKQYRQRFATSCSAEFFTCFSRSLSLSLSLSLYIYIYIYIPPLRNRHMTRLWSPSSRHRVLAVEPEQNLPRTKAV